MTRTLAIIIVGLILLSLGMACAPKTQTTPAPAPASTPPSNLPPVRHDEAFFRQLGPQLKFTTGSVLDSARALARGEAHLGWNSISTVNPLIKDGAPIKPIVLQEGAISSYSSVLSIVKNAPHPNASRVFFNWLLSKDGQLAIVENQGVNSQRNDVPDMSPPAARIDWKTPIALTLEDLDYGEQVFSSRKLVDMWGRK